MSIQDSTSDYGTLPTSSTTTSNPYLPGTTLHLLVDRTFAPSTVLGDQPLNATISKSLSSTMALVVEITYTPTPTSPPMMAVLKLYDRRFCTSLRKVRQLSKVRERQYLPHTSLAEHSYQSYVRCSGKAARLWEEIDANNEQLETIPKAPEEYYRPTAEGIARFEGALQLMNLQGECVPKMLAHLHLSPAPSSDPGEESEEKYFRVNGIMLECIFGFPLSQIGIHPLSPNPEQWESILQRAIDNFEKINRSGVVMSHCRLGNVLVETSSWKPFVHDFAQASVGDLEDKEEGFGLYVYQHHNPMGLVWVLAARLEKEKGFRMRLRYPDYKPLIQGIEAI